MPRPGLADSLPAVALSRRIALLLAAGLLTPLAVLVWAAVAALSHAAPGADATTLLRSVAPMAAAALLTLASAWLTLLAIGRAMPGAPPPAPPPPAGPDPGIDIDHKVRNLLQIVVSLLSLELRRARSDGERASLLRMQWRLQSLALVQRRTSALEAAAGVRLDVLATEIAESLISARPADAAPVETHMALDRLTVEPDHATAFALFINESLVNALHHLDHAEAGGIVSVSLRAFGGGAWLLSLVNDIAPSHEPSTDAAGMGRRLMTNCADQLGATLSMERLDATYEVRLAAPAQTGRP